MEMIGIDVGGTGIKAAVVETSTGELTTPRVRVETPHPSTPKAVAKATAGIVADLPSELSAGIGVPAGVLDGAGQRRALWGGAAPRHSFARRAGPLADRRQRRRRCRARRDALRRRPRRDG